MKLHLLVIVLISVSLFSPGCNKHERKQVLLDRELRAYFDYKPGSYWIMLDSATGLTDSFAVMWNHPLWFAPDYEIEYQEIEMSLVQFRSDTSTGAEWRLKLSAASEPGYFVKDEVSFEYTDSVHKAHIWYGNLLAADSAKAFTLLQNGRTFVGVKEKLVPVRQKYPDDLELNDSLSWFYNKENGMIKLSTNFPWRPQVLTLVREKVIR